jgi:hypothetical protein
MKRVLVLSSFCASLLLAGAANAECYEKIMDHGRLVKRICKHRRIDPFTGREVVKKSVTVIDRDDGWHDHRREHRHWEEREYAKPHHRPGCHLDKMGDLKCRF